METIKSSAEISALFKEGRRIGTPDLTLIVSRNEKQHGLDGRAAFIAGKKLGNAVWRNRAKRRMRSLFKDMDFSFSGYDVVFLAKRSVNKTDYSAMLSRVDKAVRKSLSSE